jgi:hypothetical protein
MRKTDCRKFDDEFTPAGVCSIIRNSAPDTSGVNAAAVANAQLSRDSLEFYKRVYAEQAPERERAAALNERVSSAQLAAMDQNNTISKDYWDYQKNTFRPMEQSIVADAENYDTTERRESRAAQAVADVGMQSEIARQSNMRQMNRMGVNPNSGKMMAMSNQMALGEAVAKAGAANRARSMVETQGHARKMDAANLGRGLASSQATSAGVAMNAGNSAINAGGQTLVQGNQAANMMGKGFTTAGSLMQSSGNLFGNQAGIQNQARGQDMQLLGGAMSAAATAYASDKAKKKDIKPLTDEQALDAVEKTPVSNWNYKPGMGDGGNHTGPMAQDVQKTMGDAAAPGGKQIDPITMNGITMASVAALSRKVDKLAKQNKGATA